MAGFRAGMSFAEGPSVRSLSSGAVVVCGTWLASCGGGSLQTGNDASGKGGSDGGIMTGMGGGGGDDAGGAGGGQVTVPIVGPEMPVDTPVTGTIPGVGSDTSVAFSGSEYFVVWNDHRAQWFGQAMGTRVGLDGRVLDPAGIAISELVGESSDPSVVWDGSNYLVVYDRAGTIVGRRFAPSGAAVDPVSFPIGGSSDGSHSPFAVTNGATTLVAWAKVDLNVETVVAARVTGSTVQDTSPIAIGRNDGNAYPRAAFGGGNWLVCWQTEDSNSAFTSDSILCARVEGSTGALLDATAIHVADGQAGEQERTFMRNPSVASDGSGYLVVYERTGGHVQPAGMVAARVTSAGVLLDPAGIPIGANANFGSSASVAFNAGHYQAVFQGAASDAYSSIVYGNRFDAATGTALDGPTGAPIAGEIESEQPPRIFAAGSAFYVTSTTADPARGLVGSRLSTEPSLVDAPGTPLVSPSANHQGQPASASDGINFFAVWVDSRAGGNVIYGARIDGATGMTLDHTGIQLSPSGTNASHPAVAFNGTNYLVVWEAQAGVPSGLYGTRVAPDGSILDPLGLPLFIQSDQAATLFSPGIASDGTNWFVTWVADYVYGARIAPSGVPIDTYGVILSTRLDGQRAPNVIYGDGTYLIVWATNNNDVVGERVASGGQRLDDIGHNLSIDSAPTDGQPINTRQRRHGVAYGAGTFLVSDANAHGLGQLTLARVLAGSGVIMDCCASDSAMAYDGASFVLAYATPTPNATFDIKASRFDATAPGASVAGDRDPVDWDVVTGGVVTDGPVMAVSSSNLLVAYVRYQATAGADRLYTRLIRTR
jgi:hypothetical protein